MNYVLSYIHNPLSISQSITTLRINFIKHVWVDRYDQLLCCLQVVEIMVPLLKFYFHDDCRIAAAECLPYLIDCARIQGEGMYALIHSGLFGDSTKPIFDQSHSLLVTSS